MPVDPLPDPEDPLVLLPLVPPEMPVVPELLDPELPDVPPVDPVVPVDPGSPPVVVLSVPVPEPEPSPVEVPPVVPPAGPATTAPSMPVCCSPQAASAKVTLVMAAADLSRLLERDSRVAPLTVLRATGDLPLPADAGTDRCAAERNAVP